MWQYNYDYLSHGWFSKKGKEKEDHKYIDKYKSKKGNWVYVYKEKLKNAGKKIVDTIKQLPYKAVETMNKGYKKVESTLDKTFANNKYSMNQWNYDRKVKEVEKEPEWQEIKAKKNPEYCKKVTDENGNQTWKYDIDNYIMKKKHPVLDIMDDVINGRDLSINNIGLDTLLAGAEDYLQAGIAYVGLRATILSTLIKYRQGSYGDQQEQLEQTIQNGAKVVNELATSYDENKDSIDSLLTQYGNAVAMDGKIKETAQKISEFAEKNNVDVDDILENPQIQHYIAQQGLSTDVIKKYT